MRKKQTVISDKQLLCLYYAKIPQMNFCCKTVHGYFGISDKKNIIIDQFNSFVTIKSKNLSKTHSRLQGFACAIQIGYEDAIDLKCSVATCVV